MACVGTDLLFTEMENNVCGPILRAYRAVRTDGAGSARVAWRSVGFLPFSSSSEGPREVSVTGMGTCISLYPLTKLRKGILVDRLGICASGVVE